MRLDSVGCIVIGAIVLFTAWVALGIGYAVVALFEIVWPFVATAAIGIVAAAVAAIAFLARRDMKQAGQMANWQAVRGETIRRVAALPIDLSDALRNQTLLGKRAQWLLAALVAGSILFGRAVFVLAIAIPIWCLLLAIVALPFRGLAFVPVRGHWRRGGWVQGNWRSGGWVRPHVRRR